MPAPWRTQTQRNAKRQCPSDDGGQSTNTSNGGDVAYGLTRRETDELIVQVAQMVSIHDQQIRELQACTYRKIILPATGKYGKSFIEVDTKWKRERGEGGKGAMGSKHLRLAVALLNGIYDDHQLSEEAKRVLDTHFTDMDLQTDDLGQIIQMMKWRTFQGNKDGALEFSLAPHAREAEAIIVQLLKQNNGKETQGTAPRGPAIRDIDERIRDTWRKMRAARDE